MLGFTGFYLVLLGFTRYYLVAGLQRPQDGAVDGVEAVQAAVVAADEEAPAVGVAGRCRFDAVGQLRRPQRPARSDAQRAQAARVRAHHHRLVQSNLLLTEFYRVFLGQSPHFTRFGHGLSSLPSFTEFLCVFFYGRPPFFKTSISLPESNHNAPDFLQN